MKKFLSLFIIFSLLVSCFSYEIEREDFIKKGSIIDSFDTNEYFSVKLQNSDNSETNMFTISLEKITNEKSATIFITNKSYIFNVNDNIEDYEQLEIKELDGYGYPLFEEEKLALFQDGNVDTITIPKKSSENLLCNNKICLCGNEYSCGCTCNKNTDNSECKCGKICILLDLRIEIKEETKVDKETIIEELKEEEYYEIIYIK